MKTFSKNSIETVIIINWKLRSELLLPKLLGKDKSIYNCVITT